MAERDLTGMLGVVGMYGRMGGKTAALKEMERDLELVSGDSTVRIYAKGSYIPESILTSREITLREQLQYETNNWLE